MNSPEPFMLLRAKPDDEVRPRFEPWFYEVHLKDVANIPGIAGVRAGRTPGQTLLGFYTFESAEVVQIALNSPQAAYTRATWEQWAGHLDELQLEIWTTLMAMPMYESIC